MHAPVAKAPGFQAMEKPILKFWIEIQAFQKLRAKNAGVAD
jgi:hypothetical protein